MTYGSESECATHYTTAPQVCRPIMLRSLRSGGSGHYCVPVALTTPFELGVLPLPVLVCGTVCCSNFDSQTFCSLVLKLYWRRFCLSDWDRDALWLVVKSAVYKYAYLLTLLTYHGSILIYCVSISLILIFHFWWVKFHIKLRDQLKSVNLCSANRIG